ncbi:MAG: hypothetical protein ABFD50_14070 [Smithella sp.]
MNCSTCINRKNPFSKGYCRTMVKMPSEFRCHMTKAEAIKVEKRLVKYSGDIHAIAYAKKQIKWLEGLE